MHFRILTGLACCLFLLGFASLGLAAEPEPPATQAEIPGQQAGSEAAAALHETAGEHEGEGHHGPELGKILPLWTVIPFAGILLSIALFPLFAPHFWHQHFPQYSGATYVSSSQG